MVANWCKEHQKIWFKKGKMKGFAHPIEHEDGSTTWCNRPEDWVEPAEPAKPQDDHVEIAPQERGMWFKELGEMIRCGMVTREELVGQKNEIASAFWHSYWANMMVGLNIRVEKKPDKI